MENYIGVIIGLGEYHDRSIGKLPSAKKDAEELYKSFIKLGIPQDRLEDVLIDDKATKTSIERAVKRVADLAGKNDTVIVYYAGHGFNSNGKNYLTGIDTNRLDIEGTGVKLDTILNYLEGSASKKIILFLDCCHSGLEFGTNERSSESTFLTEQLILSCRNTEHLIVFSACKKDEKSFTYSEMGHGVWSYYLLQALQGKADKEVYSGHVLMSDKLQSFLYENTKRTVEKITSPRQTQTPIKCGKETESNFVVADLTKIFQEKGNEQEEKFNKPDANNINLVSPEVKSASGINNLNEPNRTKGSKKIKQLLVIIAICSGLIFVGSKFFSGGYMSKDEFYNFLVKYFNSVEKKDTDANAYFTDKISIFYTKENVTPDQVNSIRRKMDYIDATNNIDKESIHLVRTVDDIDYWQFWSELTCYRPSINKFENCNVEMEFGVDSTNKITSIKQLGYKNMKYSKERPD